MANQRVFNQGNLDGLCGVYAIVHALNGLLAPLFHRHNLPQDVFREACRALPRSRYPALLWDGTTPAELLRAAQAACRWVERETGLGVDVSRPFLRKRFANRNTFFDAMFAEVGEDRGTDFILWIEGPKFEGGWRHWSVFSSVTDTHLRLVDSSGRSKLPVKGMGIAGDRGFRLDPRWTIMLDLARLDGEERPRSAALSRA